MAKWVVPTVANDQNGMTVGTLTSCCSVSALLVLWNLFYCFFVGRCWQYLEHWFSSEARMMINLHNIYSVQPDFFS
jgi:hypothetical protein